MARINVDDDWFIDILNRRKRLIEAIAELPVSREDMADGMSLRAWRLAQDFWKQGRKNIPIDLFREAGLSALIDCNLAEIQSGGVYVRGTKSKSEWMIERKKSASAGGKKSAEVRLSKKGTAIPENATNSSKQNRSKRKQKQANPKKPNALPLPLTLTLNLNSQSEQTFAPCVAAPSDLELREPVGADVWQSYRSAYFSRYRVEPVRDAKVNTHCKQLVKILGGDGAVGVVKFFLTHNNSFYITKTHDLGLCVSDARGLHTQWLAGYRVTSSEARDADKGQAQAQVFASVTEKLKRELEANGGKF